MRIETKREFIRDFMKRMLDKMLADVEKMPEEWNGHEIRQLLADRFAGEVYPDYMRGKRKRDYNNEVIVRNL